MAASIWSNVPGCVTPVTGVVSLVKIFSKGSKLGLLSLALEYIDSPGLNPGITAVSVTGAVSNSSIWLDVIFVVGVVNLSSSSPSTPISPPIPNLSCNAIFSARPASPVSCISPENKSSLAFSFAFAVFNSASLSFKSCDCVLLGSAFCFAKVSSIVLILLS